MPARANQPAQPSSIEGIDIAVDHTREHPPLLTRAALVPSSIDEKKRTIDVTWSTGAPVRRVDWWTGRSFEELLSMDPKHVRMGRLEGGAPVLDSHRSYGVSSVVGVVESARIERGVGVATIRFSDRAEIEPIWNDIRAGILRSVSVGYAVHKWDVKRNQDGAIEQRTAVDWEPHEISLVPIPADPGAQVRAYSDDVPAPEGAHNDHSRARTGQETTMADPTRSTETPAPQTPAPTPPPAAVTPAPIDAVRAERERVGAIDDLCRQHGVALETRAQWLSTDVSVDAVRAAILDQIGERQRANAISPVAQVGNAQVDANMRRDAVDALLRRSGEQVEGDGHRNFNDAHLVDMARRFLERGGVNTSTLSRMEIAQRALATSDFSSVLYLAGERTMRAGYDSVPLVHRQVLRRTTASDFRPKYGVAVDAGDLLSEVPEGGPIPQRGAAYEKGQYQLKSYGKIIPLTRKLIIDDNIDALTTISRSRGRSAAETERALVWGFILGNPDAPDEQDVFHTDHGNYPTASATPITTAELDLARSFFRTAKSLAGVPINASLRTIVASDKAEGEFNRLLYGYYAPQSAATGVTERDRSVQVLCEPLIGAATNKRHWLGFADPNQASSFEFAYLAGTADGVRLEQRQGFEIEGLELKVCLDFGIGCTDWRGVYYRRES